MIKIIPPKDYSFIVDMDDAIKFESFLKTKLTWIDYFKWDVLDQGDLKTEFTLHSKGGLPITQDYMELLVKDFLEAAE
jgi:hypothetical protein